MQLFAIVRDSTVLEPASSMFGMLVSSHLRQWAGSHLLGVWVEAGLAEQLPAILPVPGLPAHEVTIRESASLSGIWTLCWCEPTLTELEGRVTRAALMQALLAAPRSTGRKPGSFAPVFPANVTANDVRREMELLHRSGSGHIVPPLYQDRFTAGLFPVHHY